MSLEFGSTVDDVMRRWPVTIGVFIEHRMRCVGCPIGCFHTLDDACREHDIDRTRLMADLSQAIARKVSSHATGMSSTAGRA